MPRKKTANPQTEVVAIRLTPGELAAADDLAMRNKLPISRSARNLYLAQAAEIEAEEKDPGKCGRCGEPNPHCHYCGAFLKKGESTETHGCQDRIDQLARNLVMTAEEQYREEQVRAGMVTPAEDAYKNMLQAGIDQLEQETMRTLSTLLPAVMGRDLTEAERQLLRDESDRFHSKSLSMVSPPLSPEEVEAFTDAVAEKQALRELQAKNTAVTDVRMEGDKVVITEDLRQNPNVVILPPFTPQMTVDPGQPYTSIPDPPQEMVEVPIQPKKLVMTLDWVLYGSEIPDEVQKAIFFSPVLTELLHAIGKEPGGAEEFVKLAKSDPGEAIRKVEEIGRRLMIATEICPTCSTNCWANQWAELKKLSPDDANEKFNELRAGRTLPKDFKRWPEERRIAWLDQEWPL